jgi:hypothetical protein
VLRHEHRLGRMTPELADRAEQIVEATVIDIHPEPDEAFNELVSHLRREIAELRNDRPDA